MIAKICIRCGAPLAGSRCEYCGTEYGDSMISGGFNAYSGEITVNGENIKCYIGEINTMSVMSPDPEITESGELVVKPTVVKRKITLIEY